MNIMERVIDIPQQDVISKDSATVTVDGIAFFQILDAAKASYEVAFLDRATVKLTMTNIRSVMGGMDSRSISLCGPQRPDCVAGLRGLELGNVGLKNGM